MRTAVRRVEGFRTVVGVTLTCVVCAVSLAMRVCRLQWRGVLGLVLPLPLRADGLRHDGPGEHPGQGLASWA